MPKSRNTRKSKRQNNRIKNFKAMKSYEFSTAKYHRQPKSGGTVIDMAEWDNETLKEFYMEQREQYPDESNGGYLAAIAHILWNSAQASSPEPKGEWVVYHCGKGFTGPCIRIGGFSGDFIPDEVEFDYYVMKDWGLTIPDLYEASEICANLRQAEIDGKVTVHKIN